jgi:isoleucyl-tRNA synthetase
MIGDFKDRKIVIAEALIESVINECSIKDYKKIKKFKGKDLKDTICNHPFFRFGI